MLAAAVLRVRPALDVAFFLQAIDQQPGDALELRRESIAWRLDELERGNGASPGFHYVQPVS